MGGGSLPPALQPLPCPPPAQQGCGTCAPIGASACHQRCCCCDSAGPPAKCQPTPHRNSPAPLSRPYPCPSPVLQVHGLAPYAKIVGQKAADRFQGMVEGVQVRWRGRSRRRRGRRKVLQWRCSRASCCGEWWRLRRRRRWRIRACPLPAWKQEVEAGMGRVLGPRCLARQRAAQRASQHGAWILHTFTVADCCACWAAAGFDPDTTPSSSPCGAVETSPCCAMPRGAAPRRAFAVLWPPAGGPFAAAPQTVQQWLMDSLARLAGAHMVVVHFAVHYIFGYVYSYMYILIVFNFADS